MKNWEKEFNKEFPCPEIEDPFTSREWENIKKFIQNLLDKQKEEILDLTTEEIVIAQKEGQPTSRLTSLFNKLSI